MGNYKSKRKTNSNEIQLENLKINHLENEDEDEKEIKKKYLQKDLYE
jgi:hypothetical protein